MPRVNQAKLARHIGVNRSTINRQVKAGRLRLDADGRVDLDDALRQLELTESAEPRHQARKAQFQAERAEKAASGNKDEAQPTRPEEIAVQLKLAMLRERQAKAHRAEMEARKMAGELVRAEEVEFVLSDFGATLRGLVEHLPDRLAAEIAGAGSDHQAIHQILDDYARTLLDEMAELLKRRGKEWRPAA